MPRTLEVLFSPAEFMALDRRDLGQTVCVVFDILRATSTMMTALGNGAVEIIPVGEIDDALAIRKRRRDVLLAGERDGLRILASQTGGIDFDLGNSPREFTAEMVGGRTVVMTTTNGTRALRSCARAETTLIGSFLGLSSLAAWIQRRQPHNLLLICAGTFDQTSYEDALAAGALCDLIWGCYQAGQIADSADMSRQLHRDAAHDLLGSMQHARNGRRLLARPELRDDVPFCLERDALSFVARMVITGEVRRL